MLTNLWICLITNKIIIDCTLVLGIDSSAGQAIIKLRDSLSNQFAIKLSIFVTGDSEGFPCEINLSEVLTQNSSSASRLSTLSENAGRRFRGSHVCDDLDQALIYAEVRMFATIVVGNVPNLFIKNC